MERGFDFAGTYTYVIPEQHEGWQAILEKSTHYVAG